MPTNATSSTESSSLPRPAQDRPAPSYTCDTERHLFGPFDSHENQKKLSDWLDHNPKLAIYCRCNPLSDQPARLVIRDMRRHPSDSQRYIVLARRPGQADQHTPACRHSEQRVATRVVADDGDIASRTFSGISSTWPSPKQLPPEWIQAQPKVDRPILVDLDFSLGKTEGWTSTGPPSGRSGRHWTDDRRRHHSSGEALPRKSAAALLLRLIERAGLNQYLGQPIAHRDIFVQLRKAAALVMVRPRGALSTQRLSDILVMPDLSKQDIRDRLDLAYKSHSELLFVAPVRRRPTSVHPQDASEFHLDWSADLGVSVKSKTVWVVEHLKAVGLHVAPILVSGGMVLGISKAEPKLLFGNPYAVPENLWAVTTTAYGCPVESSHELSFAAHLHALNRHFYKPIYTLPTYPFLPDFVLLDCAQGPTPVEIFGLQGVAEYDAQKAIKQQYYGTHHIAWDVAQYPTLRAWLAHHQLPSKSLAEYKLTR